MVTLAQRLEALRTEKGLTRPALSLALGLPKNAVEKFETGRHTPTRDQQTKLAGYFGVSLAYLQGTSDDPTRQDSWMTAALSEAEPEPEPRPRYKPAPKPEPETPVRRPAPKPKAPASDGSQGGILAALLSNKAFHDTLKAEILEVLRTREGQELLSQIVKKELDRQK